MELTTSQAVRAYGVFPNVLHRMILMGRLDARKDSNGHWLISKRSLERWNSRRVRRRATNAQRQELSAVAEGHS
jgi:hypothetical protein